MARYRYMLFVEDDAADLADAESDAADLVEILNETFTFPMNEELEGAELEDAAGGGTPARLVPTFVLHHVEPVT